MLMLLPLCDQLRHIQEKAGEMGWQILERAPRSRC